MKFVYSADGEIVGLRYKDKSYYYVKNLQGDVIAILDEYADIICEYSYDAWGKCLTSIPNGSGADIVELANKNPIRYRGYYYDTETNLYYLQSRYYNPEWCRFVNGDGYVTTGQGILSYNMYVYCLNNPINYVDISGNYPTSHQVAIDMVTIIACLAYIADYAEKNDKDINAFSDFLGRTIGDNSSLSNFANTLELGVSVLENSDRWGTVLDTTGNFLDMLEIAGKNVPGIIGKSSTVLGLYSNIMSDIYNPLMFDYEVSERVLVHCVKVAGGIGIATFSIELGLAVAAATQGNIALGFMSGAMFYIFGSHVWDQAISV